MVMFTASATIGKNAELLAQVAYRHVASFCCDAEFGRYRSMADIGQATPTKAQFMSTRSNFLADEAAGGRGKGRPPAREAPCASIAIASAGLRASRHGEQFTISPQRSQGLARARLSRSGSIAVQAVTPQDRLPRSTHAHKKHYERSACPRP